MIGATAGRVPAHLRPWSFMITAALLAGSMGQVCPFAAAPTPTPAASTITVDLVNQTSAAVDPGLLVDGALLPITPLAPGEATTVSVDCTGGVVLQTDATFTPVPVPSSNTPLLQEDADFVCGDTVTFIFVIGPSGALFTQVEVNGLIVVQ